MLKERVSDALPLRMNMRLMIIDMCQMETVVDYRSMLIEHGYAVFNYTNAEKFRLLYEEKLKWDVGKIAVIVTGGIYIPYDIRKTFVEVTLSFQRLFPKIHTDTFVKHRLDWDIISFAYKDNYIDYSTSELTKYFLSKKVFTRENILNYGRAKTDELRKMCEIGRNHKDWAAIARAKAQLEYYAAMGGVSFDLEFIDTKFAKYIECGYSHLSQEVNDEYPAILTKTLDFITSGGKQKTALIVMDGMSLFDFEILSRHFDGIEYDCCETFALIPTMTSISRQSLLSGKYPRELANPFSLADEEKAFSKAASKRGYATGQFGYLRGYDVEVSSFSHLVAVVINEVDDIVHGQHQGRVGMYNDMNLLGKSGKVQNLVKKLHNKGFTVYITSDHGNTHCIGIGSFHGGVEIETRSKRMVALKDFADTKAKISEHTVEYSGFYLDKNYRYLICKNGVSFDSIGRNVMTHGGMSIDEVIVPFVKIKGVR